MFTYIKKAFTQPQEIHIGRKMKNSHYFLLILAMSFSMTFLSLFELMPIFQDFQNDISEVKETIPEFELVDNHLTSDERSFLYLTDSIAFYFDTDNKISPQTINRESVTYQAPISIGMLHDQLYLNVVGTEQSFYYSDSSVIDTEFLTYIITTFGTFSIGVAFLLFLLLFILNSFIYIYQLLFISLFTNLMRIIMRTRLSFVESAKITVLATYMPFIITYLLKAFQLRMAYQFELIFASSLIIFYMSMKDMKTN